MKIIYHILLTFLVLIGSLIFIYLKYDCSDTFKIFNHGNEIIDNKPIWVCSKENDKWSRITNMYTTERKYQSLGLLDRWSITHIAHGVVLFIILYFLNNRKKSIYIFYLTILIEILWEFYENTPYILDKYRRSKVEIYRDYIGDSIANMIGDTIFALFGLTIAWFLPIKMNILLYY